jgi:AcrR family transcriptional regulator
MPGKRSARRPDNSREALVAAATDEFALHGFDAASVDAIARRARVNKAMIYYHFGSKAGLYLEIIRGVFASMGDRTGAIAAADLPAAPKLAAFAQAISSEVDARPFLPPMMMREVAEGARRLDADTLRLMSRLFHNLRAILQQGVREGAFRKANPLQTYFSLISPIFFFRASSPLRAAMGRHNLVQGVQALDNEAFLAQLTTNILQALAPESAARPPARAARRRAPAASRPSPSGDHA